MTRGKAAGTGQEATPEDIPARAGIGLLVICAAQFLVALDLSIANVAVPHIREDLGFGVASVGWALSAYALAFASLLLIAGRIADLYGRRRTFVVSLLLLGVASLVARSAWSPAALTAGRVLQGVAAAFIAPSALGLLTHHPRGTAASAGSRDLRRDPLGRVRQRHGRRGPAHRYSELAVDDVRKPPRRLDRGDAGPDLSPGEPGPPQQPAGPPGSLVFAAAMVCAVYALSEAEGGAGGATLVFRRCFCWPVLASPSSLCGLNAGAPLPYCPCLCSRWVPWEEPTSSGW